MAWDALPLHTRRQVLRYVEREQATIRPHTLEDVVRWAVDGLNRTDAVRDAFDHGFEQGRQHEDQLRRTGT